METKPDNVSLMGACRRFFGMHPGQKVTDFAAEVRALSDEEREYFKNLLEGTGLFIITPQGQ